MDAKAAPSSSSPLPQFPLFRQSFFRIPGSGLQGTEAQEGLGRRLGFQKRRRCSQLAYLRWRPLPLCCSLQPRCFSSQSRADLLTLGLAVTNVLAGLVWLSIRPKSVSKVNPQGVECRKICSDLPDCIVSELLWTWESLSVVTCCRSLVIVYEGSCLLQIGVAAESNGGYTMEVDAPKLIQGLLYQGVMKSGAQSYLANLSLYPGKSELPFLPSNTQAVILQPLGDKGIAIIGGDTIRGFTTADQAWITLIAEKLDTTLSRFATNLTVAMQDKI
ncbi:protein COFACTOR ASSEMBLY OF COMPLEX C SUBUNIT B CCB4, chloroplastic isoform X4 [Telopea speciosissima]|uniref:protein COFACTOR ASSEMBLY OF COMPLEX C SUBUNIT B CCB4, chloroplastic isoform X4 n=1 Tax=Telopea speciosissima TaxID=54955 RepID=UPI001CC50572|nr:protein COFACTOR ASSEMBLY OF COMPLEX C SUBUNIT B CCB4, chloroplastic isoform X4 [Telopea speciosissima]